MIQVNNLFYFNSTRSSGYNTFSPNNSSTEPQKAKHTITTQQAKGMSFLRTKKGEKIAS